MTSSMLTIKTARPLTFPSATVPVTSVMAPVWFPIWDVTFLSELHLFFSTSLSAVVRDVCSSGFGLNSDAPQFVPSS